MKVTFEYIPARSLTFLEEVNIFFMNEAKRNILYDEALNEWKEYINQRFPSTYDYYLIKEYRKEIELLSRELYLFRLDREGYNEVFLLNRLSIHEHIILFDKFIILGWELNLVLSKLDSRLFQLEFNHPQRQVEIEENLRKLKLQGNEHRKEQELQQDKIENLEANESQEVIQRSAEYWYVNGIRDKDPIDYEWLENSKDLNAG